MLENKKAVEVFDEVSNALLTSQPDDETTMASMLYIIALSLARLSDDIHELLEWKRKTLK